MVHPTDEIITALVEGFSDVNFAPAPLLPHEDPARAQMCVRIPPDRVSAVMRFLYDSEQCRFEQLCDLTCVDYLNFPAARDRYGVTYSLLSITTGKRLWAKCFVNDPKPEVPSVTSIWPGAEWLEREVYDLFGVVFTGHPDLRRIVTWDGFEAHPLRKDYPLRGQGERENYKVIGRESA